MAGGWWGLWLAAWVASVPPVAGDLADALRQMARETPWVEVNTAGVQDLQALPLMSPDLLWIILQERQERPFEDFEDFARRVPLDPLQAFLYARVLRFPRNRSRVIIHGVGWIRYQARESIRQALRITVRWGRHRAGLRMPEGRGYLGIRGRSGELWLGFLQPRVGLGLLDPSPRGARAMGAPGVRWRAGTGAPGIGLRWRGWMGDLRAWATRRDLGLRWQPAPWGAVALNRRGVALEGRAGSPALRLTWELGLVAHQAQLRGDLRVRAGASRWTLRGTPRGPMMLFGRVPFGPDVTLFLESQGTPTGQRARILARWHRQGTELWFGLRSDQQPGSPPRIRWTLEVSNGAAGGRFHLERVDQGNRTGWLGSLERVWQGAGWTLRVRWAVYRVPAGSGRLYLAEGAPGLWPRVFTLTSSGARGTVAWSWTFQDPWTLVGWVSLGDDLRHAPVPEACVALRW